MKFVIIAEEQGNYSHLTCNIPTIYIFQKLSVLYCEFESSSTIFKVLIKECSMMSQLKNRKHVLLCPFQRNPYFSMLYCLTFILSNAWMFLPND